MLKLKLEVKMTKKINILAVRKAKWKRLKHVLPYYFNWKELPKHRMVDFYHVKVIVIAGMHIPIWKVYYSIECDCGKVFYQRERFNKIVTKKKN
jgi:hypothetical protein